MLEEIDDPAPEGLPEGVVAALGGGAGASGGSLPDRGTGPGEAGDEAHLAAIWRLSAPPVGPDGWPAIAARIARDGAQRRRVLAWPVRWSASPATLRVAAVVLVCLGVGSIVHYVDGPGSRGVPTVVSVPAAAMDTVELAGGVVVVLNSVSSLTYLSTGDPVREVTLAGEAYFDVLHDPDREFVVRTAGAAIRDRGTEFNVRARGGEVRVVVAEGEVEIASGGRAVTVPVGHESTGSVDEPPSAPRPAAIDAARAWLQGDLVFVDQPLIKVAAELERRYRMPVRVTPALRGRRITASLRNPSASDAVQAICVAVSASCRPLDGGWSISLPEPQRALQRSGR